MTKRMKRIAALLTCGLVLASGTSVYAGNAEGTLLGYPISLEVSVRKASAMTAGSYPKTTIYPYRYATGGSANQLIPMTAVSGGGTASVYAPDGWDIGKAESLHESAMRQILIFGTYFLIKENYTVFGLLLMAEVNWLYLIWTEATGNQKECLLRQKKVFTKVL